MLTQPVDSSLIEAAIAERDRLEMLRHNPVVFTTPKRSLLRLFGSPERSWKLEQPFLGTLHSLLPHFDKLQLPEAVVNHRDQVDPVQLSQQQALQCARVIAVAVLNSKWGIRLLSTPLTYYFLWRLTPALLIDLTGLVQHQANLPALMHSLHHCSIRRKEKSAKKRSTTSAQ